MLRPPRRQPEAARAVVSDPGILRVFEVTGLGDLLEIHTLAGAVSLPELIRAFPHRRRSAGRDEALERGLP